MVSSSSEPQSAMKLVEAYRVSVYVVESHLENVIEAVKGRVDLKYGNYDGVSWCSTPGTERFVPRVGGRPVAGEIDKPNSIAAVKLEFSIPRDRRLLESVVLAVYSAHPWDEPVVSICETFDTRKNQVL